MEINPMMGNVFYRVMRWSAGIMLLGFLTPTGLASGQRSTQSPVGQFECRDWDVQPTTLLAVVVLRSDGSYEATDKTEDLTAHRPTTSGRYTYDPRKQLIDWTSGGWRDRIGTFMPKVKDTDFVVVHTKDDPEGKIRGGALRCARMPQAQ
jgi:hypothetical protein